MKTGTAILFSDDAEVSKIENSIFTPTPFLKSSQKETETKVLLHAKVLLEDANHNINIRSLSEGRHIVILVISVLWKFKELVILDDSHRKTEKKV